MAGLALGTAQFGFNYGIANRQGQVQLDEMAKILSLARGGGVDTLDTAIAYGDCERRLGGVGVAGWRVVTKLPALPPNCGDIDGWVADTVSGSLQRLRTSRLYGLLFHRPDDLLQPSGRALFQGVSRLKEAGIVDWLGVSIYDPEQLDQLCDRFPLDLVQAPFSVVDRRLVDSGWMGRLARDGIQLHVRSVFLQGLLVMPRRDRPERFDPWRSLWDGWEAWLAGQCLTAIEGCLRFALSFSEVSRVVVGVDSEEQLRQLLNAAAGQPLDVPEHLSSRDLDLLDPSRWS